MPKNSVRKAQETYFIENSIANPDNKILWFVEDTIKISDQSKEHWMSPGD